MSAAGGLPAQRLALALLALGVLLLVFGVAVGSTGWVNPLQLRDDALAWRIVWDIRLPRSVGAWLSGALLGLAGAIAQGLFRNPLADPFLLGSASGAALGVAGLLAAVGFMPAAASALATVGFAGAGFAGALVGVLMALALAGGPQPPLRLLLAGVVVGVVLGALREGITLAAPQVLQPLQGFMLGSTSWVGWPACGVMAAALGVALAAAVGLGRTFDALALGEATAASLGLRLGGLRAALVAVLALATGAAVAYTGLVAFVGLVAPHLVQAWVRVPQQQRLPLSALMGGGLLLAADGLARSLAAPQELPVGLVTALLGGGYLLWLMRSHSQTLAAEDA